MSNTYCIYILASRSRNLYTGVTNNLERRLVEHRQGRVPGSTARYRIFRLVHCEQFGDIRDAIAREKEIKARRREKKIWLIERNNPTWADLAERLPGKPPIEDQSATIQRGMAGTEKQIPHTVRQKQATGFGMTTREAGPHYRDDNAQGMTRHKDSGSHHDPSE
jgi:putative endonuclease